MRKWIGIAVAGVMLITAGSVTPAKAVNIFAQWQDTKDLDSGFGLGVGHKFQIIPIVSVEGRISYLRFDKNSVGLNMFPFEALGRAKLGLFYGGVGLGYYFFSGDFKPDNSFGGFIAGGIEFTLFGLGAYGELRYLLLEPDGGNLNGFGAGLGVVLPFF